MIIGIGSDIIEVKRIAKALEKESFAKAVFTSEEIAYCESRGAHKYESYAARYAAKEAVGKALGTGLNISDLLEIAVSNNEKGMPQIILSGHTQEKAKKSTAIHVSLSHSAEYAIAQVVLEG